MIVKSVDSSEMDYQELYSSNYNLCFIGDIHSLSASQF